jgi:hypothetical protein
MKYSSAHLVALFFIGWGAAFPGPVQAQIVPVSFLGSGSTSFDGWNDMTSVRLSGYGGFPGTTPWANPVFSNISESADARLLRLAGSPAGGGPFVASESIYFGSFQQVPNALGGTLAVSDLTPVSGLKTIVFQIQIGEAEGHDFCSPAGSPVLKVDGASSGVTPSFSPTLVNRYQNGTYPSPETGKDEPVYVNTWLFQWNVGSYGTISSFQIEFSPVTHSQIYALQLDQTSVLQANQIIPNPSQPPQIRLLTVGTPQFDGVNTTMTHTFTAPAGKLLDIDSSQNLSATNWMTHSNVSTGSGTFDVTFQAAGDQRITWAQRMFFRAKYSQSQ